MPKKKLPPISSKKVAPAVVKSIDEWQAAALRFTGFPVPSFPIGEVDWWQKVTGVDVELRTSQPKKALFQDEGNLEGGRLTLKLEPMRIDWILAQTDAQDHEVGSDFKTVTLFSAAQELFLKYLSQWFQLNLCPPLRRLAFGAILLHPVSDRRTGYERMSKFLPAVTIDPQGSSDFVYQINRPRASTLVGGEYRINRLSKWLVLTQGMRGIQVGPDFVHVVSEDKAKFECRLELDINTAADFEGPFSGEKVPGMFDELVKLGREIALSGPYGARRSSRARQ